ncbi:MAG: flavin reductase family protein [Hyphomicrobiales bacterium]
MFYEPSEGHPFPHNPFKALVAPRPIGWIATRSKSGVENLSPYSFFNAVSDEPPIVVFSSDGAKDSLTFARESGCFVAHSAPESLFEAMNQSSAAYARGVSEIAATGLASVDAQRVNAPRLVDAPSALECVVTQIIQPLDKDGQPSRYHMVFGQVVGVHIHDDYLTEEGRFDSAKASLMARCGYLDYAIANTITAKPRPKRA